MPPTHLQTRFENRRRLEADRLGSCNFHRFTGFWVTALASGTFFDFKSSESNDLHFAIFLHALGDGGENCFEGFIGRAFGSVFAEGDLDSFNKFRFVHGNDVCAKVAEAWQEKIL